MISTSRIIALANKIWETIRMFNSHEFTQQWQIRSFVAVLSAAFGQDWSMPRNSFGVGVGVHQHEIDSGRCDDMENGTMSDFKTIHTREACPTGPLHVCDAWGTAIGPGPLLSNTPRTRNCWKRCNFLCTRHTGDLERCWGWGSYRGTSTSTTTGRGTATCRGRGIRRGRAR